MNNFFTKKKLLIAILCFALFTRLFRIDVPHDYVFDEVYHAFTAQEMARGNPEAWEWWPKSPGSFAYEWTHPPLAKYFMALGINVFNFLPGTLERVPDRVGKGEPLSVEHAQRGDNPIGFRVPIALFSVGIVYVLYLLGKELFSETVGLLAAFLVTFDGLFLVMGRTGMNDTFYLFFQLAAVLFLIKSLRLLRSFRLLILTGIFLGLALASKWTALYGIALFGVIYLIRLIRLIRLTRPIRMFYFFFGGVAAFTGIPIVVYLISYIPFFTSGHTWEQFLELQHQMWWYHTNLKATHGYQSIALSWPIMMRPVWYYVKYFDNGTIANIYAWGNVAIWWAGIAAVAAALVYSMQYIVYRIKNHTIYHIQYTKYLSFVLLAYFSFFVPWMFSPRIMFLYHYMPSLAFLILILSWALTQIIKYGKHQGRVVVIGYCVLVIISFIYIYPHNTAYPVPTAWADQYVWFEKWK